MRLEYKHDIDIMTEKWAMTNNCLLLEARNKTSIEFADTKSPSNLLDCCAKISTLRKKEKKKQSRPIIGRKREEKNLFDEIIFQCRRRKTTLKNP